MKRLFLALPLPPEEIQRLDAFLTHYRSDSHFKDAKWALLQNFHITTLFLGNVQDMMIPEMRQILRGFFAQMPSFELQFEGVFLFPGKFPKMILARFHKSFPFTELNAELRKYLSPYYQNEDKKEQLPHLTLARLKNPVDSARFAFKPYKMPPLQVKECHLYESELTALTEGELQKISPVYTLIENFPFAV